MVYELEYAEKGERNEKDEKKRIGIRRKKRKRKRDQSEVLLTT